MTNTPQDNASPTGELRNKLWRDRIKPWLDFRSYLRQRVVILKHPDMDFPQDAVVSPDWKTPLSFAIQGTVIIALLVGFIGKGFSKFVTQRPTAILKVERTATEASIFPITVKGGASWSAKQERIEKDISTLQAELDSIRDNNQQESFHPPVPYSLTDYPTLFVLSVSLGIEEIPKDEAIQKYKQEIATLNGQLHQARLAPYKEEAWKFIRPAIVAITFLLAAYLFRILINFRRRSSSEPVHRAHLIYLYFITASLFWVNLAYSVLMTVRENVEKFFPPNFEDMVHDLDLTLRSIDDPLIQMNPIYFSFRDYLGLAFTLITVAIIVWAYIIIRRVARLIRPTLGLQQPAKWWDVYAGEKKIRKDILAANLASSIIVLLISFITTYVYAVASLRLPKF